MKGHIKELLARKIEVKASVLLLIVAGTMALLAFGGFRFYLLYQDLVRLEGTSRDLTRTIDALQAHLASTTIENRDLNDFLTIMRARNTDFQNQLAETTVKVSTFEKLSSIDPELLQKYSKVYFLSENYIPSELTLIDPAFLLNPSKPVQIHGKVRPYLDVLMNVARQDGIDIAVLSGYRSFGTQATLKSQYRVTYGANTSNRFSAEQGYSEHQLGSTVDFTSKKIGEALAGFDATPAYQWLTGNAHRFGFVLSYPKGNAYYVYEPWHWRFVGVELATRLHEEGRSFYGMPQRDIDPFLVKLFD
ncbi:MAG: M15 family metallopeptidase [bacterium]|nr:M15 family metallopeptidase [bacterium]